jgi:Fur family ferric uptake transcriptional regulator
MPATSGRWTHAQGSQSVSISYEAWNLRLEQELARNHQRLTPQRRVIADVLFHEGEHKNVDEVYQLVRARDPNVGHATVYRTLKLLHELELVSAHSFEDGTARYEVSSERDEHHDHLVCRSCGHIVEFENDAIERLQREVAAKYGFELADHRMVLYGECTRVPCPHRDAAG